MKDRSWAYGFIQEWPVPKETHQLSYTIPVSHWAKGSDGVKADTVGFDYGASVVYLLSGNLNLLFEAVGTSNESIEGDGLTNREHEFLSTQGCASS